MPISLSRWRGAYALKLFLVLALVALADRMFWVLGLSHGWLGLFGLALIGAMVVARPALWRDRRAWIALVLAAGYAGAMVWDAGPLAWTGFWIAAGMAALLPLTGRFDDGWRWFQRLLGHAFKASVGPLLDWARVSKVKAKRPGRRTSLGARLRLLALPIAGSAVILALFGLANPVIEEWLAQFTALDIDATIIQRGLLALLIGWLCWSLLRPRITRRLIPTFDGSGELHLPGVSPGSVLLSLIAFNALFALQNAMDLAWLWGLMELPKGMTLAEYAHRGAYPLIATALLAAGFVLVTLRPGSASAAVPAIRALVTVWIAQNLVLVANSIMRTLDYVAAYSLTTLRIAALAWMGLVAIGLVLVCWRLLRGKNPSWLINANLLAAGALLSLFAWVDSGEIAARYNVNHAREAGGKGPKLDLCYLRSLGGSALLPLAELEQRPLDPAFKARVQRVRSSIQIELEQKIDWGAWTLLGARRLAQAPQLPREQPGSSRWFYDCSGNPVYSAEDAPAMEAVEETGTEVPAAPILTREEER
jgi:hypothetical protein